jgi:hypothetical protein
MRTLNAATRITLKQKPVSIKPLCATLTMVAHVKAGKGLKLQNVISQQREARLKRQHNRNLRRELADKKKSENNIERGIEHWKIAGSRIKRKQSCQFVDGQSNIPTMATSGNEDDSSGEEGSLANFVDESEGKYYDDHGYQQVSRIVRGRQG